jgi:hypothetical protein
LLVVVLVLVVVLLVVVVVVVLVLLVVVLVLLVVLVLVVLLVVGFDFSRSPSRRFEVVVQKNHEVYVSKTALRVVKLDDLRVDPSYQRGVVAKHRKIVAEFDEDALGVILVGQREDNSMWIVDGLQRFTAVGKLGWTEMRANVFRSRGPEHEAAVFKLVNKNRTSLSSNQLFAALLTAGDEECWAVKSVAEKFGYKIPSGGKRGVSASRDQAAKELTCVNSLVRVYHQRGQEALEFVLGIISECWPGDPYAVKTDVVDGLFTWYVARMAGSGVDRDPLVPRLQASRPHAMIVSASQGAFGRSQNMADVIERIYAKRKPK